MRRGRMRNGPPTELTSTILLLGIAYFLPFVLSFGRNYGHQWFKSSLTSLKFTRINPSYGRSRHPANLQLLASAFGPGTSRSTQIRKPSKSHHRKDQLTRVIDSIQFFDRELFESDDKEGLKQTRGRQGASKELKECLQRLKATKNASQISHVGRQLASLPLLEKESRPIQERLVRALSLAGLLEDARGLLYGMLEEGYLPSHVAYTSVCSGLRRSRRLSQLKDLLHKLESVTIHLSNMKAEEDDCDFSQPTVHTVAYNMYLAAMCDAIQNDPAHPNLVRACQTLRIKSETVEASSLRLFVPDIVSFNTVLNAAAKAGNSTIVDIVWTEMERSNIRPNIKSYNHRLEVTPLNNRCEILEEVQANAPRRLQHPLIPDQYTIDLLLIPLLRRQDPQQIEDLVDSFIAQSRENVIRDALSAFLVTLVKKGEIEFARHLFDTYIAPCLILSQDQHHLKDESQKDMDEILTASAARVNSRQFNILLEGYRSAVDANNRRRTKPITEEPMPTSVMEEIDETRAAILRQAWDLFKLLDQSSIRIDAYTMTIMMGLCENPSHLRQLLRTCPVGFTQAMFRAAVSSAGELNDPVLAIGVFLDYESVFSDGTRSWNTLLGALAKNCAQGNPTIYLDDEVNGIFTRRSKPESEQYITQSRVEQALDKKSCTEALIALLTFMEDDEASWAPKPNSQSYCIAASGVQYEEGVGPDIAMTLFRRSTKYVSETDGRLVNAIFRCFGGNVDQALRCWKGEIRKSCLTSGESKSASSQNRNLIAAYNGLLFVCGRAHRPDIALRVVYAMKKEGLEPNDVSLNNYRAGKHVGADQAKSREIPRIFQELSMVKQYESLLFVECTQYNQFSKSMSKDKRVRIIV